MSTRQHCDGCDAQISNLDTHVTVTINGLGSSIFALIGQDKSDLCVECWRGAVDGIEQRTSAHITAAGALRNAAARIAELDPDHELDPGRGDIRRRLEAWANEMGVEETPMAVDRGEVTS